MQAAARWPEIPPGAAELRNTNIIIITIIIINNSNKHRAVKPRLTMRLRVSAPADCRSPEERKERVLLPLRIYPLSPLPQDHAHVALETSDVMERLKFRFPRNRSLSQKQTQSFYKE